MRNDFGVDGNFSGPGDDSLHADNVRLPTVRKADKIVVVDDGRITEEGDHATLPARDGAYRRLYDRYFHHQRPDDDPRPLSATATATATAESAVSGFLKR
ncbi:hypothetical protein [Streptomyces lancefieldiae]|uniref:ABC transporter ATP-binding protein n=1 Tax=Streptomyces lancefieldiae TaxID=3075520 RepID=A0ABU3AVW5_9ACTN|nr:hypothetical protein [Streptomyces sp. DSM 40712]MDT0614058.1 hypothetical protein [Streptomyces sp. DSM 40712]